MVQLIRQGTRNESSIAMLRLSHLFVMATQCFEISATIRPYVSTWLQDMIGRAPNDFVTGRVLQNFQRTVSLLDSMQNGAHKIQTPTMQEIASAVSSTVDSISVYLLDGRSEAFQPSTTLSKVMDTMAERYKLTRALDYGLYECPNQVCHSHPADGSS
eukprot:SAG31_NODE_2412_length_5746_cov_5.160439_2_plen_158_part_00